MKNNVLLGLFVTVAMLLFITAVYFIGNQQNLFGARFTVSAVFADVKGLQPGNNVRYAGIDVGTVDRIALLNDSMVRVDMAIDESVLHFLRRDAIARIGSDGLVGNIIVSIRPGAGQLALVQNGDRIASDSGMETEELLNALGRTNQRIARLTGNLIAMTDRINNGAGTVGMLLNDTILADELRRSVVQVQQTTRGLRDVSYSLQQLVGRVEAGEGLAGGLLTDTTVLDHLRASSEQVDTLLSSQVRPLLTELQTSGDALSAFSADLEKLGDLLTGKGGPVGALLQDSLMQRDLRETLQNVNEGTARFNDNMEALKHNFLFRGYFRKQEKRRKKG